MGPGPVTGPKASCDMAAGDASLLLCVTFDHNPMVQDLSSYAHVVTEAMGVMPIDHNGTSTAASLVTTSRIHVADHDRFDVTKLTIDMWIAPAASSLGHRSWILDNNTQYFLTYESDGKVRCGIGSKVATSNTSITDSTWHHVACTYDTNQQLRVYVDGDRSGCIDNVTGIPTGGKDGIAIGANYGTSGTYAENYVGSIDGVHVLGRAMSDTDICTAAGKQSCRTMSCNQSGPGPGDGPGD